MEKNWRTVTSYIDESYIRGRISDEIEYGD